MKAVDTTPPVKLTEIETLEAENLKLRVQLNALCAFNTKLAQTLAAITQTVVTTTGEVIADIQSK